MAFLTVGVMAEKVMHMECVQPSYIDQHGQSIWESFQE